MGRRQIACGRITKEASCLFLWNCSLCSQVQKDVSITGQKKAELRSLSRETISQCLSYRGSLSIRQTSSLWAGPFRLHRGGIFCVEHTRQCPGSNRDYGHLRIKRYGSFPASRWWWFTQSEKVLSRVTTHFNLMYVAFRRDTAKRVPWLPV